MRTSVRILIAVLLIVRTAGAQIDYYFPPWSSSMKGLVDHFQVIVEAEVQEVFPVAQFRGGGPMYGDLLFRVTSVIKGPGDLRQFVVAVMGSNTGLTSFVGRKGILFLDAASAGRMAGLPERPVARYEMFWGASSFWIDGDKVTVNFPAALQWLRSLNGATAARTRNEIKAVLTPGVMVSGKVSSAIPAGSSAFRLPAGGRQAAPPVANLYLVGRGPEAPQSGASPFARVALDPPVNGQFEINVPPGSYELFAGLLDITGWGPAAPPGQALQGESFGRVSIDVHAGTSNVNIVVRPGIDLKGRIFVDGVPGTVPGLQISVQPDAVAAKLPAYQQVAQFRPSIEANGTFVFPSLPEARYRISASLAGQPNAAVDVLLNGRSIRADEIQIGTTASDPVEIVVRVETRN
ncbi:MAG TPA: hypothetical protein VFY29_08080 [Terriglobia bacterium]|nr:hypothetical protein [Terriglobia bacterium]